MTKPYEFEAIGNIASKDTEKLDQLKQEFNQLLQSPLSQG